MVQDATCHAVVMVSATVQDATCHAVAGASAPVQIRIAHTLCAVAGFRGMLTFSQQQSFVTVTLVLSSQGVQGLQRFRKPLPKVNGNMYTTSQYSVRIMVAYVSVS